MNTDSGFLDKVPTWQTLVGDVEMPGDINWTRFSDSEVGIHDRHATRVTAQTQTVDVLGDVSGAANIERLLDTPPALRFCQTTIAC